jgi:hypothetical protein
MDDFETCITNIQYIDLRLGLLTGGPSIVRPTPEQKKEAVADSRALHTTAKAAHGRLSQLGMSPSLDWVRDQVARIGANLERIDKAIKDWEK